jgi:23S rRNA (guanosine2251-2'-O)-methyltransferase
MKERILIYGKHPVISILKKRGRTIYDLFVSKNNEYEFRSLVQDNDINLKGINVKFLLQKELDKLHSDGDKNNQGYILFCGPKLSKTLDDFISECKNLKDLPHLLILDQILDPHNLGALIRSAVAFNVFNIIITERNSAKETAVVAKTSVGLNEIVDLIEVVNITNTIKDLKKIGYFVYGADGTAKMELNKIKDNSNIALVLGNEGKGIRELVKKNCDELIKIPMNSHAESLNVSVAGGILMYGLWS